MPSVVAVPANTPFDLHGAEKIRQPSDNFQAHLLVPTRNGCMSFSSKTVVISFIGPRPPSAPPALGAHTSTRASAAPRASPTARRPAQRARLQGVQQRPRGLQRPSWWEARGEGRGMPHSPRPRGWRLSGDKRADCPADCDVCIAKLSAADVACLLGCPKRAQHSASAVSTVPRLFPAASSLWRGFRLAVFEDMIRPALNWGSLAPARSCRINEPETMPNFLWHRHVIPENATKVAIERARSRESQTSLVDDRTSDSSR